MAKKHELFPLFISLLVVVVQNLSTAFYGFIAAIQPSLGYRIRSFANNCDNSILRLDSPFESVLLLRVLLNAAIEKPKICLSTSASMIFNKNCTKSV